MGEVRVILTSESGARQLKAAVVVEPTHANIARTAIRELELRCSGAHSIRLFLIRSRGEIEIPTEGRISYLEDGAVIAVRVCSPEGRQHVEGSTSDITTECCERSADSDTHRISEADVSNAVAPEASPSPSSQSGGNASDGRVTGPSDSLLPLAHKRCGWTIFCDLDGVLADFDAGFVHAALLVRSRSRAL